MAAVGWTGFMFFLLLTISMGKNLESSVSHLVGQTVTLPCNHTTSGCSTVFWLFNSNSNPFQTIGLVAHGKVTDTQRPGRLTVGFDCSLQIKNLNTEDAGWYFCRLHHNKDEYTSISAVSLSVSESNGGFPVVAVAASCAAVCVGMGVTIVIILIYKRRQDNQQSSNQVKVPDTDSVTYAVVDVKKSKQEQSNRKTDNLSVEYAAIRTPQ